MLKKINLIMLVLLVAAMVAGCGPQPIPPDKQPRGVVGDQTQPESSTVEELSEVQIDRLNVYLKSKEKLNLKQGAVNTSVAKDVIEEILSDMFLTTTPDKLNADIVVDIKASSGLNEKFGDFYSFDGDVRLKVINSVTSEIIDARTFTSRGERELNEYAAAASAIELAAEPAAEHLAKALKDKSQYLLTTKIIVENIKNNIMAQNLRTALYDQPGIDVAELDSYDAGKKLATYNVRYAAIERGNLSHYLYRIKGIKLQVLNYNKKTIWAKRK